MKQFAVITGILSVSFLVVWIFFLPGLGSSPEAKLYASDEFVAPVSGAESRKIAPVPVYDANGSILGFNPNEAGDTVSRAESRKVAPVFDTRGCVVSDPSGAMWNVIDP